MFAVKSVIVILVRKMHVAKDEAISPSVHVCQDYLEIHTSNVHANTMNHNAEAIQIVQFH